MKPLSLTILSDPHYYSKKNWVDGNPYQFPPKREQQYRRVSEEIIKYVFDEICSDGISYGYDKNDNKVDCVYKRCLI